MKIIIAVAAACCTFLLSGCVSNQPRNNYGYNGNAYQNNYTQRGTIERIDQEQTQSGSGLGTIGGAVAGGVLGNQVGKGTGKTIATVVGAAAGAYAGHEVEKNYSSPKTQFRITVRLYDGRTAVVTQPNASNLRIGDRVRIEQNRAYPDY
ncbi:MAG: glycine zipper 2TM domain-containing protein [Anaerolineae bacterium]|nr:glycine zipper 2TM domain-containing protein [Anaerolineae bacterium]